MTNKYTEPIITDRAQSDIDDRTSKGFFNVSDWLRIRGNTEVARILVGFLQDVTIPSNVLGDVIITTIPTVAEVNAFLENIESVRLASGFVNLAGLDEIKHDWIAGRAYRTPDYNEANSWERVLSLVYNSIAKAADYRVYCGVAASGHPRFWQYRFRVYPWIEPSETPVRRARLNVATCGADLTRNNNFRRYDL